MLTLGVPSELGGMGASIAEIAAVDRELARHCGSTALAISMHHHVTAFTAWRWRRDLPGAEATLKRVAGGETVLVSTGGGDFTTPKGRAVKVDGGYRVSGRKQFCSQSPVGAVMSTMFAYDDPERGCASSTWPSRSARASPCSTPGTPWACAARPATTSRSTTSSCRTSGCSPIARTASSTRRCRSSATVAFPIVMAVYLGVAEGAATDAVTAVAARADDPSVQRGVGLMTHRLRIAGWALDGALATVGDDPAPSMETVAAVMAAKREIAQAGIEVCDLAMELAGGAAFCKGSRDRTGLPGRPRRQAAPFGPEATLLHAGRLALGLE